MWDVRACRSCLTVKGKLEKIGDASRRQYSAITGLQISEGDGYPLFFCVECRHHIRKSLAFRRKSRRAHFVLKEILAVRKQISYSDIVTVNRKKTNLESSLNFWEPSDVSCFLIANEEGQTDDTLQKYELEATPTRFPSKHLVDITPDVDTDIQVETTEQAKFEEDSFNGDIPTNDYLETEPELDTANIDLNDVFKDLNEDNKSDDDGFDDFLPLDSTKPKPKPKVPANPVDSALSKHFAISTVINTLVLFDLTALDKKKQIEVFEKRKHTAPFLKALYKCGMCLTVHKTMEDLVKHVKYHNERKCGNECTVCKNKFYTEEELTSHVASCHLYLYKCRICQSVVSTLNDAVTHARQLHTQDHVIIGSHTIKSRLDRKAALSDFTITALSQRMMSDVMVLRSRPEHKAAKESDDAKSNHDNPYKCDICGIRFKFLKNLEKHMVLKHRYMYTCNICKEVFTTRFQALQHHEGNHSIHKCEECGKVFSNKKKLRDHIPRHIKKRPCNLCGVSLKSEKGFYKHQVAAHGYVSINDPLLGDPQYKCRTENCGVQFANKRSLEVHLVDMNHAGVENVPYACVTCKKLYENDEELETHYITCRDTNKYPRTCCYVSTLANKQTESLHVLFNTWSDPIYLHASYACSEVLRTSMEYKLHYIHVHPTLPYRYASNNAICDICGKSVFKPLLESHRKTHEGAGFECRLCSTANSSPAFHISHMLANHTRRPYKCALCTRRFKFRSDCKDHILKVHAPTKLFKCEFCAAEFSYFPALKEHAEKLHGLAVQPIKSKIRFKSKNVFYVYAHMKILINEQERGVVEQLKVELLDYLEQKSKEVDSKDYFIFNPLADEEVSLCMRKKKKRKKKSVKQELEAAVAQITLEWPASELKDEKRELKEEVEDQKTEGDEVDGGQVEMEQGEVGQVEMEQGEVGQVEMEQGEMGNVEMEQGEVGQAEMELGEVGKVEIEEVEEEQVDGLEIDGNPLEVVESDGHQYVMINGEMYRIATEDDE